MFKGKADYLRPSVLLGLAAVVIHLLVNGRYGIFRDEMYFIICGQRPDWGFVDQPPLIPLLASWSYALFGDNLIGFRIVPMLAMAATVAMAAEFARAIGGNRFAQWLAGLCVLAAPHFLAIGLLFTTDTFQTLGWLGCFWCLVRIEQTRDERWWLAFGLIAGATLLGKYMIAFFLVTLAVGLLATPLRRSLLRPWVYLGMLIAAAMILPNVLWQQAHGWPFQQLGEAAKNGKNVALSPFAYFTQQLLLMGPLAAPVWLAGLFASVWRPKYPSFRALPIAYVLLIALFVVNHGKAYYLTSFYPILFPIGAVAIEGWVRNAAARATALAAVALCGVLTAPLAVPVLSEEAMIRYAAALGMAPSATAGENNKQARLPQHFADMHGWHEMAAKVAAVYNALPPHDRARAVFFGNNYGEAAAIDIFGRRLGLPPAIGGHNNYWIWGPRGHDGSVVIIMGGTRKHYEELFRSVEEAGRIDDPYAMPYETDQPIYVLRDMKVPLDRYWPKTRHYQ
jgi:4-amino-4-deoxy-L-arabinose transferase-like glycosyltransferase